MSFEGFVVPKYKIASVNFRKGRVLTLFLGQLLTVFGFFSSSSASRKNKPVSSPSGSPYSSLAWPWSFHPLQVVYSVDLIMQAVPKGERLDQMFLRALMTKMLGPDVVTLTLAKEPDRDFIMSYVFGTLGSNMGGTRALTHLVRDHLVDRPEPPPSWGPSRAPASRYVDSSSQYIVSTGPAQFDHSPYGCHHELATAPSLPNVLQAFTPISMGTFDHGDHGEKANKRTPQTVEEASLAVAAARRLGCQSQQGSGKTVCSFDEGGKS